MKNIHVLKTDKPSRLAYYQESTSYSKPILQLVSTTSSDYTYQHIYITSDEEIKEGDIDSKVCIFKSGNGIITCLAGKGYGRVKTFGKYYEVILTTDPQLIADGVQVIPDEFLEWFVNNPSCEEVEVFSSKWYLAGEQKEYLKIIIPKEEPKQDKIMERFIINAKQQETLEEVAERLYLSYENNELLYGHSEDLQLAYKAGIFDGAKWYVKNLKVKVQKAIDVIQELPIDEVSKQGGISALKLILNE